MVPSRRRLTPTLTILVLLSTVSVFAIALPGCGSSSDETSGTGTVSSGDSSAGSAPDVSKPASGEEQATTKSGQQRKSGDKHPSKESNQARSGKQDGAKEQGKSKQGDGYRKGTKGSVCPSGMSRAECRQRIEAATGGAQAPGKEVSPSNCTDVMTEEQCEEIVRAQKAAEKKADNSVSPETCLEEYSREFCEERFGEQYEQQAGQ
jgi:hypothetical protein